MDDSKDDKPYDDRSGPRDNSGERFDFRPNSDEFPALDRRVQQEAISVNTKTDHSECEQHREVHRDAATDPGHYCSAMGLLHVFPHRTTKLNSDAAAQQNRQSGLMRLFISCPLNLCKCVVTLNLFQGFTHK